MAKKRPARRETVAEQVLDDPEASLLDLLDHVLNKGVMATGDVMLGVAGIDLIYLRLSALLCAADLVLPEHDHRRKRVSGARRKLFGAGRER